MVSLGQFWSIVVSFGQFGLFWAILFSFGLFGLFWSVLVCFLLLNIFCDIMLLYLDQFYFVKVRWDDTTENIVMQSPEVPQRSENRSLRVPLSQKRPLKCGK